MADILSSTSTLSNLVPTYYSKRLLERLTPNCRAYQLAEKRTIPANSGKVILWNQYVQLDDGVSLSEGTILGPSAMSTTTVSATLVQYGNVVKITDLVDETAISNIVEDAVDILSDNAAITIDKYILNSIGFYLSAVGAINAPSVTVFSYAFPVLISKTSGAIDSEVCMARTNTVSYNLAAGTAKLLPMTVSAIRKCVTQLRRRSVSPHQDGFYHAMIHPTMLDAMRGDSAWTSWNQYSRPEKMERGLVGEVEGVKFYDDPNMSSFDVSGAAILGTANVSAPLLSSWGNVYGTIVFGRGAYAVTELEGAGTGENATKVYVTPRDTPDKADTLHQFGYVGYKATLAAKILNPSCGVILLTSTTNAI